MLKLGRQRAFGCQKFGTYVFAFIADGAVVLGLPSLLFYVSSWTCLCIVLFNTLRILVFSVLKKKMDVTNAEQELFFKNCNLGK